MNRKIKKLIRDPKLFFNDMFSKRKIALQRINISAQDLNPIVKPNTRYTYEIVIVINDKVLNLHRCISSIYEQQSMDFEHVNITILDLGAAAEQKAYIYSLSESVKIFSAENAMEYLSFVASLKQNYTLFLWGDDFLDMNFIQSTDNFLLSDPKKVRRGSIICTSVLKAGSNKEVGRNFNPVTVLHSKLSPDNFLPEQMVVESIYGCLFPSGILKAILRKFSGFYVLKFDGLAVFFEIFRSLPDTRRLTISSKSKYLVHEDNVSNAFKENSWDESVLFTDFFVLLCNQFNKNIEGAKKWKDLLRRSFFYLLLKYIKKGLINQSLLDNISFEEKEIFLNSFRDSLDLIDINIINKFNVACAEQLKVGCLNLINKGRVSSVVDVLQYDIDKDMFMLRYYTSSPVTEYFMLKNIDVIPVIDKNISHNLFDKNFFIERVIWLDVKPETKSYLISIKLDNKIMKIRGLDKKIVDTISPIAIKKQHNILKPKFKPSTAYLNAWIFMDRDNQADDNAEHLYRYVHNFRPDIPAWFVLQRESHDWKRLSDEGFKLLAFGELEHERALESCSRVISSHAAQFATDYFKDKRMTWKKFVFLQHGVIHNDQSALFKPDWKKFDVFVTSSIYEYKSIVDDMSPYKFTAKEAVFTGLPRHDALINSDIKTEKIILVMPTWRPSLLGKVISGTERELLPDFVDSEYARTWYNFLSNEKLKISAEREGYKIVFFPHANIQPYLGEYILPEHVVVLSHSSGSIQELFLKASIMVTDYSSVAFEMAYINKPVCYYQFDENAFFNKGHYNKGYFSYRDDGFGPVYNDESNTVDFVIDAISKNCVMQSYYSDKANDFFPYRDGRCCERTVSAIENLDSKEIDNVIFENSGIVKGRAKTAEWAKKSYDSGNIILANRRYESIFNHEVKGHIDEVESDYIFNYIDILMHLGYLEKAKSIADISIKLSDSQLKKIESKRELINSILMESNSILPMVTYSDIENIYYNRLFVLDYTFHDNFSGIFLRECDRELLSIYEENPMNAAQYLIDNSEFFDFNTLSVTVLRYKILELSGQYEDIIKNYLGLSEIDKQHILVKFIYLKALYNLNKWGLILKIIGNSSILQGRTLIPLFATCYFFGMLGARKKISRLDDYSLLYSHPISLQFNCRLDILKYMLYVEEDLSKSKLFIDECFDLIPIKVIEDFAYKLCAENFTNESYLYFKKMIMAELSTKSLTLFGELAMSYGDYDVAVECFQQACLSRLPDIDHELRKRLATARIWANDDKLLIRMSLVENE